MITNVNANVEDCVYSLNCTNNLNCNEATSCISDYDSLELHVQNSKAIINNLTEAFYSTGHEPARFVKITYKFQVPFYSNDTDVNDTYSGMNNYFDDQCSSVERLYYWSSSPIYLMGPQPLLLLSLFAIRVQEENVIVQLPCLQSTEQKELLSRLTYLVCFKLASYVVTLLVS